MPDDPRIQQLLEELLESRGTPESVCDSCPELLPQVRERWRQMCRARDELDELFPPMSDRQTGPSRPLPGDISLPTIPGYEVDAVLGVGGMGVVFRARHLRLNRVVALKMVLAGAYAGRLERERFQREAEAIATLRHPNIIQIHDVGDTDSRPYFTMEFLEGGSLAQKLAGLPQPARDVATLMESLALAVHAAHSNGIVHRDLKPGNILLTADGIPKVSDFGLARRLDGEAGLTRTGAALGTPNYMAPEQTKTQGDGVGPAADIYSLGAILYELLRGRPPFLAESTAATLAQLLSQDPVPPSRLNGSVPRDLETICLKCLQKEPRLRYVTAALLADEFRCFLKGEAIAARPDGLLRRLGRWVWRRPVVSGAVVLATISTIALVGGGMWLVAERTATARAAEDDLHEMVQHLQASSWPEAKAARDRAIMRLGANGPAKLNRLADRGTRDLDLSAQFDTIHLKGAESIAGGAAFETYDKEFTEAFRAGGLGEIGEEPENVVKRIGETNISQAIVVALDHYSVFMFAKERAKSDWAVLVARQADPDKSTWIQLARDQKTLEDSAARAKLIATVPLDKPSITSLLAFERYVADGSITLADRVKILRRYQAAHPNDHWLNLRCGDLLAKHGKFGEAIGYIQAALAAHPGSALSHYVLAGTLRELGRREESLEQFRQAVDLNPTSDMYHQNFARGLLDLDRQDEAVSCLRKALQTHPNSSILYSELGFGLERQGHLTEALACHNKAVEFDPIRLDVQKTWREFCLRQRRLDDALVAWQKELEAEPSVHDVWYGCAELSLFLGKESDYLRQRQQLLKKFGSTNSAQTAERTSRACLLLPGTKEEMAIAKSLTDFALAVDRSQNSGVYPYYLFAGGLAAFRQERFERAIEIMRGDAARVLGPAPRLVLAMALYKTGNEPEARRILAAVIVSHDWRIAEATSRDSWIFHVLRREAQRLILPNLPAFLSGNHQPQDNDERLAMIGECQATNRPVALSRIYVGSFDASPKLAENYQARHYQKAAIAAALAGCGIGEDATQLEQSEREKWRAQARQWLRALIAQFNRLLDEFPTPGNRDGVRSLIKDCQNDPDLRGLREPAELDKLSPDERKDSLAVWDEFKTLFKRCDELKLDRPIDP